MVERGSCSRVIFVVVLTGRGPCWVSLPRLTSMMAWSSVPGQHSPDNETILLQREGAGVKSVGDNRRRPLNAHQPVISTEMKAPMIINRKRMPRYRSDVFRSIRSIMKPSINRGRPRVTARMEK